MWSESLSRILWGSVQETTIHTWGHGCGWPGTVWHAHWHCSVVCRKRSRQGQNFAAPFKSLGSAHLPPLLPAPAMTSWGPPQPACWHPHPTGQCAAPFSWSQAAAPTAAPVTPNIALTISEMLSQPQVSTRQCDSNSSDSFSSC